MPARGEAIDGRRATRQDVKWRSYGDGFHDGVERCATRIALYADTLDGDAARRMRSFARWLQAGQIGSNKPEPDPLIAEATLERRAAAALERRASTTSKCGGSSGSSG